MSTRYCLSKNLSGAPRYRNFRISIFFCCFVTTSQNKVISRKLSVLGAPPSFLCQIWMWDSQKRVLLILLIFRVGGRFLCGSRRRIFCMNKWFLRQNKTHRRCMEKLPPSTSIWKSNFRVECCFNEPKSIQRTRRSSENGRFAFCVLERHIRRFLANFMHSRKPTVLWNRKNDFFQTWYLGLQRH